MIVWVFNNAKSNFDIDLLIYILFDQWTKCTIILFAEVYKRNTKTFVQKKTLDKKDLQQNAKVSLKYLKLHCQST